MAKIQITNLKFAEASLSNAPENWLTDLSEKELSIQGGVAPVVAIVIIVWTLGSVASLPLAMMKK